MPIIYYMHKTDYNKKWLERALDILLPISCNLRDVHCFPFCSPAGGILPTFAKTGLFLDLELEHRIGRFVITLIFRTFFMAVLGHANDCFQKEFVP